MAEILKFVPKKKRSFPGVLFSTEACVIKAAKQDGIPILIDECNGIVWPVVHYFTYLRVVENRSPSTLKTYSDHLRMFWEYLSNCGVDWLDVDDDLLTEFRNRQRDGLKVSHGQKNGKSQKKVTINGRLVTILGFYWWCYNNGLVTPEVIGPPEWKQEGRHHRPQIVVGIKGYDPRASAPYKNLIYTSPLMYKNPPAPKRVVPTDAQVSKMHANLERVRDILLAQWTELTSLRVHELGRLCVSHIPSQDKIDELRQIGGFHQFIIKGKGGKERVIFALSDLLESTRDYIELERAELVARCRKKDSKYKEPPEIFLEMARGLPLKKDTISKYIKTAFKAAGFVARFHDLRAKYASDTIQAEIDAAMNRQGMALDALVAEGFSTILIRTAEKMGHSKIETLRPYLDLEKKRLFGESDAKVAVKLEESVRGAERRLKVLTKQLGEAEKLRDAAVLRKKGDRDGAIGLLEGLLEEWKSDGRQDKNTDI